MCGGAIKRAMLQHGRHASGCQVAAPLQWKQNVVVSDQQLGGMRAVRVVPVPRQCRGRRLRTMVGSLAGRAAAAAAVSGGGSGSSAKGAGGSTGGHAVIAFLHPFKTAERQVRQSQLLPTCRSRGWSRQRSTASGWRSAAFWNSSGAAGLRRKGARKAGGRKKEHGRVPVPAALQLCRISSRVLQRMNHQGLPSAALSRPNTHRTAC